VNITNYIRYQAIDKPQDETRSSDHILYRKIYLVI